MANVVRFYRKRGKTCCDVCGALIAPGHLRVHAEHHASRGETHTHRARLPRPR